MVLVGLNGSTDTKTNADGFTGWLHRHMFRDIGDIRTRIVLLFCWFRCFLSDAVLVSRLDYTQQSICGFTLLIMFTLNQKCCCLWQTSSTECLQCHCCKYGQSAKHTDSFASMGLPTGRLKQTCHKCFAMHQGLPSPMYYDLLHGRQYKYCKTLVNSLGKIKSKT